jgi:plastocyanin
MRKGKLLAIAAVLALAGAACSSSTGGGALQTPPGGTTTPPPATSSTPAASSSVEMNDQLKFVPDTLTVAAGTTVTWTNTGTAPHTVTSDTNAWTDSGQITGGKDFKHTFTTAGTYKYHCTIHPTMKATVVVT